MTRTARRGIELLVSLLAAFEGVIRLGGGIPGSPRSDLWNSLWGLWFAVVSRGSITTKLLDAPTGGTIVVSDPLNALMFAPLTVTAGAAVAWAVAVAFHVVFASWAADALAEDLGATDEGALVAGLSFGTAPLLLASIHGATSESIAWGWLPLALLAVRRAMRAPRPGTVAAACAALALAAVASPYLAVATWIGAAILVASAPSGRRAGALSLVVATLVVLPWVLLLKWSVTTPDNLVGIKDPRELALVRRTIGCADPLAFVMPGDFRSPDFRRVARYGEDYRHCPYLGWVWVVAAASGFRRWTREGRAVAIAGVVAAALALGPVLVRDGQPVLLPGNRGIPLPYLLVEHLPGFSSLSLVYRLSVLASLAVALLAGLSVGDRGRGRPAVVRLVALGGVLEVLLASPMHGGPDAALLPDPTALRAVAAGPAGAVMNWPVVGGRDYLYEQTLHGHPVAGTLNFAENAAAREVWAALRDEPDHPEKAAATARRVGIRWLVLHDDPTAGPGPYDGAVAALPRSWRPYASSGGVTVYEIGADPRK